MRHQPPRVPDSRPRRRGHAHLLRGPPEAARCLALGGARRSLLHPTLAAAMGDGDISLRGLSHLRGREFRVPRGVARRQRLHDGPKGTILAEVKRRTTSPSPTSTCSGGCDGGDAMTHQRARPGCFRMLAGHRIRRYRDPPVERAGDDHRLDCRKGFDGRRRARFREADDLRRAGKIDEAIRAFEKLCDSWIDRVAARAAGHAVRPRGQEAARAVCPATPTGRVRRSFPRAFTSVHQRSPDPTPAAVTVGMGSPGPAAQKVGRMPAPRDRRHHRPLLNPAVPTHRNTMAAASGGEYNN